MSDSSRTQLYYAEEAVWGEIPLLPLNEMRFTKESLTYAKQIKTSDELRSDRQLADFIEIGAGAEGSIDFELSYGAYDSFLKAALMSSAWSLAVNILDASDISALADENKYVSQFTDFTTFDITEGQWIKISGFTADNNNGYKRIVSFSAFEILVETGADAITDEDAPASTIINGSYIRNGVTKTSFTIERLHDDVTQFFSYLGMSVDNLALSLVSASIITGSFSFKGKSESLAQVTIGTGASLPATTNKVLNTATNVLNLLEGSTLTQISGVYIQQIGIDIKNNARPIMALTSHNAVDMGHGRCDVTGSFKAYLTNSSLYNKCISNVQSGLSLRAEDALGNAYIITIPSLKFNSIKTNAGGINQDVIVDLGWTAIRNITNGHTIQIDRFGEEATMRISETVTISAQNTFTPWVQINGRFQVHIIGLVGSTVTFQGSPDSGVTVYDLDTYAGTDENTMHVGTLAMSTWKYRVGVKTGGYASDTVILRMEA